MAEQKLETKNKIIRSLLDNSYFMEPVERLTYRLLLHYAFIVNDDPSKISDNVIQKARDFAVVYVNKYYNVLPDTLDEAMHRFVNKEIMKYTTGIEFDDIKMDIINKLSNNLPESDCYITFFLDDDSYDNIIIKSVSYEEKKLDFYIYNLIDKSINKYDGDFDTTYNRVLDYKEIILDIQPKI